MAKYIGRKVEAGIALEAQRGVGVLPAYALGKIDFSVFDKTDDVRDESGIGRIEDSLDKFVVERYVQGAMGGILGANSALYLLSLALGSAPSTGATSDGRTAHTISVANTNQHQSASLFVKDVNQSLMHKLLMLNQLEISVTMNEAVMWSAEFTGKVGRATTHDVPAYVEDYKFTKRKAAVRLASDVSGLGAASRLPLKEFRLRFVKNTVRDSVIGTAEPVDIQNQQLAVEGEIKLNYNDQTTKQLMLNGSYRAMRLRLESEKLIGTSSFGDVQIDLSKLDFFQWEPDSPNDEIVSNTIQFKGNYHLTSGLISSVTVGNALASA